MVSLGPLLKDDGHNKQKHTVKILASPDFRLSRIPNTIGRITILENPYLAR